MDATIIGKASRDQQDAIPTTEYLALLSRFIHAAARLAG
jgi:hypothetical protein